MSIRVKYLPNAIRASEPSRCCCCRQSLDDARRSVRLLGAMAVVHPDDEASLPPRDQPVMGQWNALFPQESFGSDLGERSMTERCAAALGLEWSRPIAPSPGPGPAASGVGV